MLSFGDLADKLIDIFRNTRAADAVMYIASLVQAFFKGE